MDDNVKKWLRLSIFNTIISILVSIILIFTSFLGDTTWELIVKIFMALISTVEIVCTYVCWEQFLLKRFGGDLQ